MCTLALTHTRAQMPHFTAAIPGWDLAGITSRILCKLSRSTPSMQASTYRRWTASLQPSGWFTLLQERRATSAPSGWLPSPKGAPLPLVDASTVPGLKSCCRFPETGWGAELSYSLLVCRVQKLKSTDGEHCSPLPAAPEEPRDDAVGHLLCTGTLADNLPTKPKLSQHQLAQRMQWCITARNNMCVYTTLCVPVTEPGAPGKQQRPQAA